MLIATILDVFMIFLPFISAAILGLAIYYFIRSRRSLKNIILSQRKLSMIPDYDLEELEFANRKSENSILQKNTARPVQKNIPELVTAESSSEPIHNLKDSIIQQRNVLENLLNKVQEIEEKKIADKDEKAEREELSEKIELLEWKLKEKDQELMRLKQQETVSKNTEAKLEEVYKEFNSLQSKITQLETQAGRTASVEMELIRSKDEYEQLKKDMAKRTLKIDELIAENQKKHQQVCEAEDKLANLNRKLHTEMRRIGELESMLHMVSEERDNLLQKYK